MAVRSVRDLAARRAVVHVCRRLAERGLVAGMDGNVSVRLDARRILCTPSGATKADLGVADLVVVDLAGHPRRGTRRAPSSELDLHLRAYARRPEVRAVVHAHPPTATGWAVAGRDFMAPVLPEVLLLLGRVPLVPFGLPGTPAVADAFEPFFPHHDVFLMAHHGALALGSTLTRAHQRMESLEHAARILAVAATLGSIAPLPGDVVARLDARKVPT
ncbi:MAG: class II aldolase/adducin family protein [Gemmatimonadaceae bacterium]|jgi:L-fuculose-phosphate aldolase|nr:class II aldolase/adducin family protein [Gemmatimonadaceae bacterium]